MTATGDVGSGITRTRKPIKSGRPFSERFSGISRNKARASKCLWRVATDQRRKVKILLEPAERKRTSISE
jgi:hypothetical protein